MNAGQTNPAGRLKPVGTSFRFSCHPGVACFGVCCQKLDLVLTPYDLLRLNRRLGLGAGEFLDRFTLPADPRRSRWPLIRLAMQDDGRGRCPFLAEAGCSVYEDRPSACRTYPLARAARKGSGDRTEEQFFLVEESHCLGFSETREFTIAEWVADQGLVPYHHWNDRWMEILTHPAGPGRDDRGEANRRMFYLASYNLDRFREFVSTRRFRSLFDLNHQALAENETLLALALAWMRFSFFGEKTMRLKTGRQLG